MDVPRVPYILATAGHVDHGKSALVQALTGTDPDRLPEEKLRGITIDLGFASLRIASPPGAVPAGEYEVGIIDVPGHEDFVKNMVAGVGSIDAALLVVAADDEWMPQTEEHLQILTYLGVNRGVVAVSKIDLAQDERAVMEGVKNRLRGTPLENAPLVATSVMSGRGIEELKQLLAQELSRTPSQRDIGKPRLPVDRVFSIKGVGTVVTGTLTGGILRRGQSAMVRPAGTLTKIRTVQTYNREVETAFPGSRVALNLPDLHPSDRKSPRSAANVRRGDVITVPQLGESSAILDVLIDRLPPRDGASADPAKPVRNHSKLLVHHGSVAVPGRVHFYDAGGLQAPGRTLARLVLETPILALAGDRFVLRDWPQRQTLAGGIVLDPDPPDTNRRRIGRDSQSREFLEQRALSPSSAGVFVATQLARDGIAWRATRTPAAATGLPPARRGAAGELLSRSRFSVAEVDSAVESLIVSRSIVAAGELLITFRLWTELRDRAIRAVDEHHKSHPEQGGLPLNELHAVLTAALPNSDGGSASATIDSLLNDLCRDGFLRSGAVIRRSSHRPALPIRLQPAGEKLRQQLAAHPFDPPSRKELSPTDVSHQALKFLIASGEAIEIGPELVMSAEAFQQAVDRIRAHLGKNGSATVSELKTVLGSTRRIMVPLLEKLDREGITVRQGEQRKLRTSIGTQ